MDVSANIQKFVSIFIIYYATFGAFAFAFDFEVWLSESYLKLLDWCMNTSIL